MRAIAFLSLALAGCGGLSTQYVQTGTLPGRYAGNVSVYLESQTPPPYRAELGIVQAHGWGNQANLEAVLAGVRRQAAELGGDAVVRVRFDQGSGNASAIGLAVVTAPP